MNKLLTAGLVAAVAMTSANASQCGNGGFYVQGNLGISSTQMKYQNNLKDQKGVINYRELSKMQKFTIQNGESANLLEGAHCYNYTDLSRNEAKIDVTKKSLKKRKGMFLVELGLGYDFRINDVMIGFDVNFGKNFGNVKKKTDKLAMINYTKAEGLQKAISTVDTANNAANVPGTTGRSPYIENQSTAIGTTGFDAKYYVKEDDIKNAYDPESTYEMKMKNKYFISLMPRVGYLVSPEFEIYLTAGVKLRSDKYTVVINSHDTKVEGKKSVTKCIPAVGAGLRYEFGSGMFANFSVIHNFKSKKTLTGFKKFNDTTTKHKLQASSTDVKVGFGYRF